MLYNMSIMQLHLLVQCLKPVACWMKGNVRCQCRCLPIAAPLSGPGSSNGQTRHRLDPTLPACSCSACSGSLMSNCSVKKDEKKTILAGQQDSPIP